MFYKPPIRPVRWLVVAALALATPGLWAVTTQTVVSEGSIKQVAQPPATGPMDPRQAYIKRATLQPEEAASELQFEVALKMRNFAELQARVANGEVIPFAEMAAKYYPTQANYDAVAAWLTGQGFKITRTDDNRLAIFATASVDALQQKLKVNFARVTMDGKDYTSAVTAPSIPATLAPLLVGINGLQPHIQAHKHIVKKNSLTGTSQPYTPAQILHAYSANGLTVSGSGQTIAIVIDTFPLASDLATFWSTYGVAQSGSNISYIQVVSGSLAAPSGEESLDAEWSSSMAPKAKVRIYATYDLADADLDTAYQQIFADVMAHPEYGIHQMTMSYGIGETYTSASQVSTDAQYFANLSSAGVTIFASSGDGGYDPGETQSSSGPIQVENPASDPSVTGVGGTSITLTSGSNINTEVAWSDSGGGISEYFSRPTWQTGTGVPVGATRLVPDVAAPADPNEGAYVWLNGSQNVFGGTSWSSPVWAGLCALINQSRANVNLPPVGLLGPKIYPLIGTSSFHDITSGGNGYSAGTGYDMVTGIGSPSMQNLVTSLVGLQTVPLVATLAPGSNATFAVAASGSATAYQWQRMPLGSGSWSNITASGTYSGVTTGTLTINGVTIGMSGDRFQCLVTTGSNVAATAPPSVLVVDNPLIITTLAGQPGVTGTANGQGSAAQFNYPSGAAIDSSGNIYIADFSSNTIRKVTPAGVVTTPYGQPNVSGTINGSGTSALFNTPNSVAIDGSNNIYVADSGNNTIRKITPAGVVSTFAGKPGRTGTTSGTGSSARFNNPQGVAVDSSGNVYVADTSNELVRKITASGSVSTLAGTASTAGYLDGSGTAAKFNGPISVAVDSSGNVYVADLFNYVVREISPSGAVVTAYGQAGVAGRLDGIGPGAQFNAPIGVAVDNSNTIYVADSQVPPVTGSVSTGNNTLRRINTSGVVSTIAGTPGISGTSNGTGTGAQFFSLQAVAVRGGAIYLADTFNQTLRVGGLAPVIILQPQGAGIVQGGTAAFSVAASGTPSPGYQWWRMPAGSGTFSAMSDISGTYAGSATAILTVSNATLAMNGDEFECVASNGFSPAATSNAATLGVISGYTAWAQYYFGAQSSNSSISGPTATPRNDGITNAEKYLLGINPSGPMQTSDYAALPSPGVSLVSGTQYITLTYRENPSTPGLTQLVQTSTNLTGTWQTVTPASSVITGTDASTGDPIIQVSVPTNGAPKMFIRLNVTVQ